MFPSKKIHILNISLFFAFFLLPGSGWAQDIESDIESGFRNRDPVLIVRHFGDDVKLIIKEDSYSPGKEESVRILREFFARNEVVSFESRFDSKKQNSNFMIKVLNTADSSYRITIFFKKTGDNKTINLLRIEQENEPAF